MIKSGGKHFWCRAANSSLLSNCRWKHGNIFGINHSIEWQNTFNNTEFIILLLLSLYLYFINYYTLQWKLSWLSLEHPILWDFSKTLGYNPRQVWFASNSRHNAFFHDCGAYRKWSSKIKSVPNAKSPSWLLLLWQSWFLEDPTFPQLNHTMYVAMSSVPNCHNCSCINYLQCALLDLYSLPKCLA